MKTFFFQKMLFIYFLIFPNSNMFLFFLQKNFTIKVEKIFLRNDIILYAFYSNFATCTYFEKKSSFCLKHASTFSKKTKKIRTSLRNLTLSVTFHSKLAKICRLKKMGFKYWLFCLKNSQVNVKIMHRFERKIFFPIFKTRRKVLKDARVPHGYNFFSKNEQKSWFIPLLEHATCNLCTTTGLCRHDCINL